MYLWEHGRAFDYLSDRCLAEAAYKNQSISLGGNNYSVILVPACQVLPETTLLKLIGLARQGATVLFQDHLPPQVPGWNNLKQRQMSLQTTISNIHFERAPRTGTQQATIGKGAFLVSTNLEHLLNQSQVRRELCVDSGLRFVRRKSSAGFDYFLVNRSERAFDGWVPLAASFTSAVILDLRLATRTGTARLKPPTRDSLSSASRPGSELYLQLQPGESCIVRVFTNKVVTGPAWPYKEKAGSPRELTGTWRVKFIEGGPELPGDLVLSNLVSWTESGGAEAKRFAGTALYTLEFEAPAGNSDDCLLELGKVCDSARVRINGKSVGAFWCAPFQASIGDRLHPGKNTLEVEVTNLAANRIADLDRRKVKWKYFYDINVASKRYKAFDAADWSLRDSGLLGPVTLTPMTRRR
jgi:hypothetical protein